MSPGLSSYVAEHIPAYYLSMTDDSTSSGGPEAPGTLPQVPALLPPLNEFSIFLAGFRDCKEEAIKYLVEVEKIPLSDPLILGLQMHLCDKQENIDVSKISSDIESDQGSEFTGSRSCSESEGSHSPEREPQDSDFDSGLERSAMEEGLDTSTLESHQLAYDNQFSQHCNELNVVHTQGLEPHTSGSQDSSLPVPFLGHVLQHGSHGQTQNEADPQEVDLSTLAQNNPAVASLTKELFELLDEASSRDSQNNETQYGSECLEGTAEIFGRESPMNHD